MLFVTGLFRIISAVEVLTVPVKLVDDKRNVKNIPNANDLILPELTKRVQRVFPDAEIKVKPMQANSINTDANKSDKSIIARVVEEMFDDAGEWLV